MVEYGGILTIDVMIRVFDDRSSSVLVHVLSMVDVVFPQIASNIIKK